MKYLALLASICLLAITVAAVGTGVAQARTAGYTCSYKMHGAPVYLTIYGSDNMPYFCAVFVRSAGSGYSRWYGYVPGHTSCQFMNNQINVFVRVKSTESWAGSAACIFLGNVNGWTKF